jgi:N-acetylglucosaminyl-diphospho-decaprenol L-rhamnosyltransferase
MPGHVAVTIVGYRNSHDIVDCVTALQCSDYANFEIVICENGGPVACATLRDQLPSYLAGGQRITIIEAKSNGGYASGINICISASPSADAWWLLNPDTMPSRGAMSALIARLGRGYDAVGGTIYFPDGRVQSYGGIWRSWLARAVSIGNGEAVETPPDTADVERRLMYLSGASMMVSRVFVEKTGPMPEEFFLYCEEIDWCLRAVSLGLKLGFSSDALVLHRQGTTTGNSRRVKLRSQISVYLDERNKMLISKRHFPRRLFVAAPAALVLLGLRYLRKGAFRQFLYGAGGWFSGIRGEQGPPSLTNN